jgi:two-component system, cell cycle response regulator CpdR
MLSCASSPSAIGWRVFSERWRTMANILIAEDEEALRSLVARALGAEGHAVKVVPDGAEALEALGREPFDLLLADIKMPVMDGIALALAAARDYPTLVMMLMTGYADQRERACGLESLIHDVLTKPFTLAELRQAVGAALAAGRAADGLLKTL